MCGIRVQVGTVKLIKYHLKVHFINYQQVKNVIIYKNRSQFPVIDENLPLHMNKF